MRLLEILLMLSVLAAPACRIVLQGMARSSWSPVTSVVIIAVLAAHIDFEGWREQMLPVYAAVALLLLLEAFPAAPPRETIIHLVGACAVAGLVAMAAALCIVHPVIQTPVPTGSLLVGTTTVPLFEGELSSEPVFRIWYPADGTATGHRAPYLLEDRITKPRRLKLGRTQSLIDASLANAPKRFPVLIFFPGWGGVPSQSTVLLQDLASHGYVIAAADPWDKAAYPHDAGAAADLAVPLSFGSDEAAVQSMAAGARNAPRQASLAQHVLDRLQTIGAAGSATQFSERLDLDHVGMLGFSFGGSVAVQTAVKDLRIHAVANLDGCVFTDAYARGFSQPYLLLSEPPMTEVDLHSPNPVLRREAKPTWEDEMAIAAFMKREGGNRVIIRGMAHTNFSDAPLLYSWRNLGGAIDPARARIIIEAFLLRFFDQALRGAAATQPDDVSAKYPEVTLLVSRAAKTVQASTKPPSECPTCTEEVQ